MQGQKSGENKGFWRKYLDSLHARHAASARPLAAVWRAFRMAFVEGGASATMAVAGGGRSAVPAIPETARARLRRRSTSPSTPGPLVCGMWLSARERVIVQG